jgi:adenosine deaminase
MIDFTALPKVELHCHLDGILDPDIARAIRRDDPTYPIDPAQFATVYPVENFEDFWNWLEAIKPIKRKRSPDLFYPIVRHHIENLKAQNVRYAELMISGGEVPLDTAEAIDVLSAFREAVNVWEAGQIQIEFLGAFGRGHTPEDVASREDRFIALYQAGLIVGTALAGREPDNPMKAYEKTFARFHEVGLGIEIHAGEWVGPESVWEAITYGYPDRIGHGVSLFQDERLIDVMCERKIHIEMCPSSNLKTGSVERIEDHPIYKARELGMNYSVNTDDPGIFECSMTSEYALLADTFGFTQTDFEAIYANSLSARFGKRLLET